MNLKKAHMIILAMLSIASTCIAQEDTVFTCGTSEIQGQQMGPRPIGLNFTIGSTHFLVHYTKSGPDSTTDVYAQSISEYAEASWTKEQNHQTIHNGQ